MIKFKDLISKLRHFSQAGKAPTIYNVWLFEFALSLILLASFLAFDFWIYKNYVLTRGGGENTEKPESRILLNRGNLQYLKTKLTSHESFLESPSFPSVRDPF